MAVRDFALKLLDINIKYAEELINQADTTFDSLSHDDPYHFRCCLYIYQLVLALSSVDHSRNHWVSWWELPPPFPMGDLVRDLDQKVKDSLTRA